VAVTPIDVDRLQETLVLIDQGELGEAVKLLAPLVKSKRHTRPSRVNAEQLEVDEVKGWLLTAIADPSSDDARFYVDRAYYKLRTQRPAEA
jgi:hypothetical protein